MGGATGFTGAETTGDGDEGEDPGLKEAEELIRGGFLRGAGWLFEAINSFSSGNLARSEPDFSKSEGVLFERV